jgi:uncharacterized protein YwgA
MNDTQRKVVLAALIDSLREHGSWCGETHIQKNTYALQELFGVPLDYDFILYKHGPFSFELRDELSGLRGDGLLEIEPQPRPYGPSLATTSVAAALEERFPKTMRRYKRQIAFVTQHLGNKGVVDLEHLSTALLVTKERPKADAEERARRLRELKPHVSLPAARRAVEKIDEIIKASQKVASTDS